MFIGIFLMGLSINILGSESYSIMVHIYNKSKRDQLRMQTDDKIDTISNMNELKRLCIPLSFTRKLDSHKLYASLKIMKYNAIQNSSTEQDIALFLQQPAGSPLNWSDIIHHPTFKLSVFFDLENEDSSVFLRSHVIDTISFGLEGIKAFVIKQYPKGFYNF